MENKNVKSLLILCLITNILVIIAIVVMGIFVSRSSKQLDIINSRIGTPTSEASTTFTKIDDASTIQSTGKLISDSLTTLMTGNYYINLVNPTNGDVYALSVYNSSGESLSSTAEGETVVYMKDNNTVQYSDNIYYGLDVNNLQQIYLAVQLLATGKAELLLNSEANKGTDVYTEWLVDVRGWDNVRGIYEQIDEHMADDVVAAMRVNLMQDIGDKADVDNINIRYSIVFDSNDVLQACACYYYFGADSVGAWNECFSSWAFEDIVKIDEWKLSNEWYDFDYDKMAEGDNPEKLSQMLIELKDKINAIVAIAAENNGMTIVNQDAVDAGTSSETDDMNVIDTEEGYSEYSDANRATASLVTDENKAEASPTTDENKAAASPATDEN